MNYSNIGKNYGLFRGWWFFECYKLRFDIGGIYLIFIFSRFNKEKGLENYVCVWYKVGKNRVGI